MERDPIRVLSAPALDGVTVIDAHWAHGPPPDCMFEAYVLRLHRTGALEVHYRRAWHHAGPGLYTVQPGEMLVHRVPTALPLSSQAIVVEPELFTALAHDATRVGPAPVFRTFRIDEDPDLAAAIADLVQAIATDAPPPEQESLLHEVVAGATIHCVGRAAADPPDDHSLFRRLQNHLAGDLTRTATLAELAGLSGLSRFQVLRLFRTMVGVPPHTYLIQLRVARARRLLSAGGRPAEVAAATGFADQSHLGRHFLSIAARTPAGYLDEPRRGASP